MFNTWQHYTVGNYIAVDISLAVYSVIRIVCLTQDCKMEAKYSQPKHKEFYLEETFFMKVIETLKESYANIPELNKTISYCLVTW